MSEATPKREERRIEKQIEIAASPEEVWKAFTTPEGLKRWFPLEASVNPGAGGEITLSWGPGWEASAKIEAWEPGRRLSWVGSGTGQPLKVECTIETRGGKTIVTLVQSSFATGADWENEFYDSTNYGWGFMLINLRHYLERFAGNDRGVAWPRLEVEIPRPRIYEMLAAPGALFAGGAPSESSEGKSYALKAATGEEWSGRVEFVKPPRGFCVTVKELNDALLWLTIEGAGPRHDAQLWFSTYQLPADRVRALESTWAEQLKRILG
jgi:uncharacterized protein YndB with AHSA1/START domain